MLQQYHTKLKGTLALTDSYLCLLYTSDAADELVIV